MCRKEVITRIYSEVTNFYDFLNSISLIWKVINAPHRSFDDGIRAA